LTLDRPGDSIRVLGTASLHRQLKSRTVTPAILSTRSARLLTLAAFAFGTMIGPADAIDVHPTPDAVAAALDRGRQAARDRVAPDRLYAWFGPADDLEPRGFVMTKLVGLTVMATHFALRGETPSDTEIRRVLEDDICIVSVTIFGATPTFARDSYMLLTQQGRTIKPTKVRFDGQAARSAVWPAMPAFRAKVVGSFRYGDLDPRAPARLSILPGGGGEVSFDLDFNVIE
jgi:hypothetical protein